MTDPTPAEPTTQAGQRFVDGDSPKWATVARAERAAIAVAIEAEARDTARRGAADDLRRLVDMWREQAAAIENEMLADLSTATGLRSQQCVSLLVAAQQLEDVLQGRAAPPQPSAPQALDVERLRKALHEAGVRCSPNIPYCRASHRSHAESIAAEYARLSRLPSEEER